MDMTIQLVSFNILNKKGVDKAKPIAEECAARGVDIACFQEVFPGWGWGRNSPWSHFKAEFARLGYNCMPQSEPRVAIPYIASGLFFGSKLPCLDWKFTQFKYLTLGQRRGFVIFVIERQNTYLHIVCSHAEPNNAGKRSAQLSEIYDGLVSYLLENEATRPLDRCAVVICGDLNVDGKVPGLYSDMMGRFADRQRENYEDYVCDLGLPENSPTFSLSRPTERLDYVLTLSKVRANGQDRPLATRKVTKVSRVDPTKSSRLSSLPFDHFWIQVDID